MKIRRVKLIIILTVFCLMIPLIGQAQNLLSYPQKIVIDNEHERLLVSNFGNGALVQIDPEGNQSYFSETAGFIDGLDIVDNVVYGVGSQRRLIAYDLETEEQIMEFTFPGNASDYLSSVTSDSSGHLFISCPPLHTIYRFRLSDQSYWIFAENNGLNRPNGILLERENDRIVVIDDSPGTSLIHAISLTDSTVSTLATTDLDRPDGIVRDRNGVYYIGGYYLPGLYRIDADFSQPPELFFEGDHMVYPTYDTADHSLLITYYSDHSWERVLLQRGTLLGTVSLIHESPLEDVLIEIGDLMINPDASGFFSLDLPEDLYDVTASLTGYETLTAEDVEILEDQITSIYFLLYYMEPPSNLECELVTDTVYLTWEHIPPPGYRNIEGFNIYRNVNGGDFEILTSTTEYTYADILQEAGEYSYYVTGQYAQGNESGASNTETVNWDGTDSDDADLVPAEFLLQNFPNPFNPTTTVNFVLQKEQQVSVEIYNLKGQLIRILIQDTLAAGDHTTTWDGKNDDGDSVPSGIYVCYIRTNGKTTAGRKMLLLK